MEYIEGESAVRTAVSETRFSPLRTASVLRRCFVRPYPVSAGCFAVSIGCYGLSVLAASMLQIGIAYAESDPADSLEAADAGANASSDRKVATADRGEEGGVDPSDDGSAPTAVEERYLDIDLADLDAEIARIQSDGGTAAEADVSEGVKLLRAATVEFSDAVKSYKRQARQLVQREYFRHKTEIERRHSDQIASSEAQQDSQREHTIEKLERFVRRYPNDAKLTPDAMFRLGELYFEQAQIAYQNAFDEGSEILAAPNYTPTVETYLNLVARFPEYERIDGVLYLVGFCLSEMGDARSALAAWRSLVCHNRYPEALAVNEATQSEALDLRDPTLGGRTGFVSAALSGERAVRELELGDGVEDIYEACTPVQDNASFITETWFRIGEYHFDDYDDPKSIQYALYAYAQILGIPDDRNYNLALYKTAWAYYRSSQYALAMKYFGQLVDWSDAEQERTGRAGSELRPESIQYLALSLAYDDWNENQVPDVAEGMPSPVQRAQDPKLLPQNKSWTPEVYFHLGQVLFDEVKYAQAIAVWELAINGWPLHPSVPEYTNSIALAYSRDAQMETAIKWIAKLSDYRQGSAWWNANLDRPVEQRRAEELAEGGLVNAALFYHQKAQQTRQRCVAEQDVFLCELAAEQYGLAAMAYGDYLERFPNTPRAYELQFNLADTYFWSGNSLAAAHAYEKVRDSNLDNRFLSEAARLVVESRRRLMEDMVEEGRLSVRDEAVSPEGTPPVVTKLKVPVPVIDLVEAREAYLKRVSVRDDRENVRNAYAFNNGLMLYFYGYWGKAEQRFSAILGARCKGELADQTGQVSWVNLRNMAVALDDREKVEKLGAYLDDNQCTFAPDGVDGIDVDCALAENKDNPYCIAGSDLINIRYARAVELFNEAEATEEKEAQWAKYERASALLLDAVNEEPEHPEAPLALEKAAIGLERTERYDSASALYERIIRDVGARKALSTEDAARNEAILANAYFRLGVTSDRFMDFERSLSSYRVLVDSQRFKQSEAASVKERREDALINTALLLERVERHAEARRYFVLASAESSSPEVRQTAAFKAALMTRLDKGCGAALSELDGFITRSANDPKAAELRVEAAWTLAECRASGSSRVYAAALDRVITLFDNAGLTPGSAAADFAARAAYARAEQERDAAGGLKVSISKPRTMDAYVAALAREIDRVSQVTARVRDGFDGVKRFGRARWTIASFTRVGEAYEALSRAVLGAPFLMPADLEAQLRRVSADQKEDIRIQVEDRIRMLLDERVRPLECMAINSYVLGMRLGKASSLATADAGRASDRLQAYGAERVSECIAEAQGSDATMEGYTPGEFDRAPAGKTLPPSLGLGFSSTNAPTGLATGKASN